MKNILISITTFLFYGLSICGTNQDCNWKDNWWKFEPVGGVRIESSDTILLATTDYQNGEFTIEINDSTINLLIRAVGYDWKPIILNNDCKYLEAVLVNNVTCDYTSLEACDKYRIKFFKKVIKLHKEAYAKGIFKSEQPCYKQSFTRYSKLKKYKINI